MTVTAEQQQRAAAAGGEGKQQKHALPCRASRDAAAGGRRGLERPGKPRAKARRKLRPRNFRNLLGEASSRRACKVHGSASPRRASLADVAGSERRDKVFSLLSGGGGGDGGCGGEGGCVLRAEMGQHSRQQAEDTNDYLLYCYPLQALVGILRTGTSGFDTASVRCAWRRVWRMA